MEKSKIWVSIKIKQNVNDQFDDCIAEFVKLHPEHQHMTISRNKIIFHLINYYLRGDVYARKKE